jgi:hypothetical protein
MRTSVNPVSILFINMMEYITFFYTFTANNTYTLFAKLLSAYNNYKSNSYYVKHHKHHHYTVNYRLNGVDHCILLKKRKNGGNKFAVSRVLTRGADANDVIHDCTNEVIKFMGPCSNFHGVYTTPHDLGYDYLRFEFLNGTSMEFDKHSQIVI